MAYEVWVFGDKQRFQRSGGLVEVREVPPAYSRRAAEDYARGVCIEYGGKGLEVSTVVRTWHG